MAAAHAAAFADVPGVELLGIQSRTRARAERLAREAGIASIADSVAELHERTAADIVVVTVPPTEIEEVALACLEHPWTVLLEKPPGLDLAEAETIAAAAASRTQPVLVALNRRFLSSTRTVLEDVSPSGPPRYIRVVDQESLEEARALGHPEPVVRRWMYANAIHLVDFLSLFGRGGIESVERVLPWDFREPAVVLAAIRFESGDIGVYEGTWNGPGPWGVVVATSEKRWELRPLEEAAYQLAGERRLVSIPSHAWDREFKPGLRLQAEHAVAATRGGRCEVPTIGDSLRTMQLVEAIFRE